MSVWQGEGQAQADQGKSAGYRRLLSNAALTVLGMKLLLVSGVAGVREHLNVVPRLHYVTAHQRVDDRPLDHICKHNQRVSQHSLLLVPGVHTGSSRQVPGVGTGFSSWYWFQ